MFVTEPVMDKEVFVKFPLSAVNLALRDGSVFVVCEPLLRLFRETVICCVFALVLLVTVISLQLSGTIPSVITLKLGAFTDHQFSFMSLSLLCSSFIQFLFLVE